MIRGKTKVTAEEVIQTLGHLTGLNVCIGWDDDDDDDFDIWYKAVQEEVSDMMKKLKKLNRILKE